MSPSEGSNIHSKSFTTITSASYQVNPDSTYVVSLEVDVVKYRADSLGNESTVPLNDYMDIGIFGVDEMGKDKLIYLKKHLINEKVMNFKIQVDELPVKAGIDPINKLIDRNPDDNVISVDGEDDI